jgi:hypothetical protein
MPEQLALDASRYRGDAARIDSSLNSAAGSETGAAAIAAKEIAAFCRPWAFIGGNCR